METWCRHILLTTSLLLSSLAFSAEEVDAVYQPDEDRIILHEADIDAQDIELGVYGGIISVQDFGTNSVTGVRFAYHISEDFFLQASYAETTLGKTSFEKLNPGFTLLSDDEREYNYYNIGLGYNLFQGESFFSSHAFNSAFYFALGVGSTTFADDKHHTLSWGFGYRIIFLDWLAMHIEAKDHIFESDIFAQDEQFQNVELSTGLTVFF